MIEAVPEFYDGGYWYATAPLEEPVVGGKIIPINTHYSAWYAEIDGVEYAAVRAVSPVSGMPASPVSVNEILGASGKPMSRIGDL